MMTKKFKHRFVAESNAIEGYNLYDDGPGTPLYDQHAAAFDQAVDMVTAHESRGLPKSRVALQLHATLMRGLLPDRETGQYRTVLVLVGGNLCPQPQLIERLMQVLEDYHPKNYQECCVEHMAFEIIHPFVDGNGRVGRLLRLYSQLLYTKERPDYIPLAQRREYYLSLDAWRKDEAPRFFGPLWAEFLEFKKEQENA